MKLPTFIPKKGMELEEGNAETTFEVKEMKNSKTKKVPLQNLADVEKGEQKEGVAMPTRCERARVFFKECFGRMRGKKGESMKIPSAKVIALSGLLSFLAIFILAVVNNLALSRVHHSFIVGM